LRGEVTGSSSPRPSLGAELRPVVIPGPKSGIWSPDWIIPTRNRSRSDVDQGNGPEDGRTIAKEAGVKVVASENSLYGDTLGPDGSDGDTYVVGMIERNTRVESLK